MSAAPEKTTNQTSESSAETTGTWRPHVEGPEAIGPLPKDVTPEELLTYMSAGMSMVKSYRTHGHLAAKLDPLGSGTRRTDAHVRRTFCSVGWGS